MTEESKSKSDVESAEEQTISFSDNGKQYKVGDLPDEAKALLMRWNEKSEIRNKFTAKAQNDIDDLNRLMASYQVDMLNILEPQTESTDGEENESS
jgi:hypothetical protein